MSTEGQSPEDNIKRAQEQARKALGLPPSYVSADEQEAPIISYEEPAALAYDHEIQDRPQPSLQLVANDKSDKITAKDIDALADEIEAMCRNAGVSQDEIAEIIEKLNASIGAPKAMLGALKEAAKDMADAAVSAAAAGKAETPEEKKERLWGEVKALQEDAREKMLRLLREGKITQEEFDRWDKLYTATQDPKLTEEQRIAASRALATETTEVGRKVGGEQGHALEESGAEQTQKLEQIIEQNDIIRQRPVRQSADRSTKDSPSIPQTSATATFSGFGDDGNTSTTLAKEAKAAVSPTLVASFSGFGTEGESSATATPLKDAKSAVSPTLVASFSGFDAPEGAPAQTPGAKPKDVPTRQA